MRNLMRFLYAGLAVVFLSGFAHAAVPSTCTTDTKEQEQAIAACTAAIESTKSTKDDIVAALKIRSELNLYMGEKDDAQADLTRALELRPKDASLYASRAAAREEYDSGNAIADMNSAIDLNPKNADYYVQRAKLHLKESSFYEAEKDYSTAVKLDPKNPKRFMERFSYYGSQHEFEKALADATQAVALGDTEQLMPRAQVLMYLLRFTEASSDLDKYVGTKEFQKRDASINVAIAFGMRGYCNLVSNQIDKAIADYSKAITAFDNRTLRQLRGNAFIQMKQYELAIQDYSAVLKIEPNDVATLYLRAVAYDLNGQPKLALADRTDAAFYSAGLKQPKKN